MKYAVVDSSLSCLTLPDARSVRVLVGEQDYVELQIRNGEIRLHATSPMKLTLNTSNNVGITLEQP